MDPKTNPLGLYSIVAGMVIIALGVYIGFDRPPIGTNQVGYRGVGMEDVYNPRTRARELAQQRVPEPIDPVEPAGTLSKDVYANVQVLGDLDSDEFTRLMSAITEWVSPEQGCAYCHAEGEELSSDSLYTKVVARRMLQMTQHINNDWHSHVGAVGVTCYTCHRGQPVPANIWFEDHGPPSVRGMAGYRAGQNVASAAAASASLPTDPFTPFLLDDQNIRVIATSALPEGTPSQDIKATEWTYSLMMHMSDGLGVNCTHCHNSRSFFVWEASTPARVTAWHGIRMARDLNVNYLNPLRDTYPANRLGPNGDAPKANCATCHVGLAKPLNGVSMVKDYTGLGTPAAAPATQ
jgi:photosynthetic reaction center cytochrome c subunit